MAIEKLEGDKEACRKTEEEGERQRERENETQRLTLPNMHQKDLFAYKFFYWHRFFGGNGLMYGTIRRRLLSIFIHLLLMDFCS